MAEGSGFQARGVDLSLHAIQYAKETLKLSVIHGTVFDARFPDDSFDAVVMLGVLEHILNPIETLREAVRILKKDGILVVEVPNATFNLARGRISPALFYLGNHLYNFTPNALTRMLETCGLRCARVWCGKGDYRSGWLFNTAKCGYVLATRFLQRIFGWYWGPSLIALAVKA
jgi:SAM-dependent methyltransferase